MKRVLALMLAAAITSPGCAVRLPVGGRSFLSRATLSTPSRPPQARYGSDQAAWERYLDSLPIGAKVKVETRDGKSFKGIFMGVENGRLTVRPRTRIPEPARVLPIESVASVELDQGSSTGRTVAIAAGVAAATVLGVFLALWVAIDD